jgi:hypothetical protein
MRVGWDARRRVDGHVVGTVVEELGTSVSLDVVGVEVSPSELHVDPVLAARGAVEHVLRVGEERRARDVPLVGREEENVGGGRVHLVTLPRVCERRVSATARGRVARGDVRIVSFWTVSI